MGVGLGGEEHESEWGKIKDGVKDLVELFCLNDLNIYPFFLIVAIGILMIIFL